MELCVVLWWYEVIVKQFICFPHSPAILSTLYGYDDCIGGVNNFDTEEEYYQELKRWLPDL